MPSGGHVSSPEQAANRLKWSWKEQRLPKATWGEDYEVSGREIETDDAATRAMMANPTFQKLTRSRSTLGWTLATIMWVIYFGFILLVAFNKSDGMILSTKIATGSTTSVAIVAGFAILITTFVITSIYVVIANSKFDRLARELRGEVLR